MISRNLVRDLFAIDLLSLALFRVGLALVLLFDLASRLPDLRAHDTDQGVLPRSGLLAHYGSDWNVPGSGRAKLEQLEIHCLEVKTRPDFTHTPPERFLLRRHGYRPRRSHGAPGSAGVWTGRAPSAGSPA